MAKDVFLVIRGSLDWAKLTGTARPHTGLPKYDKGPYWSTDVTPDAKSRALLKANGLDEKLRKAKGNDTRKETFISLRVLENRADGSKNDPPKITTVDDKPWTGGLLGNGTIADVKVKVKDYGSGSEKGVYLQAVRILKHVPYEREEFEALSEDDEFFAAGETETAATGDETASTAADPDLDDDVPF